MQFKIKKTEYVNKTFRITKDLNERLSQIAQKEDISMNELVVQCCEFALSNLSDNKEKQEAIKKQKLQISWAITASSLLNQQYIICKRTPL